ncbi:Homeodomain-like protein [Akanthomyces lecanii RCEF 1005]|uniref:Homeodomain-like protein n=1 Tax=Akanthomyces lecanii RCEF 1005 TaxID=1081108 RepID=A0A167XKB2_CORDF|nr:Homeodomain-like protein [Akanthomyces lecanii RCEF 1005]
MPKQDWESLSAVSSIQRKRNRALVSIMSSPRHVFTDKDMETLTRLREKKTEWKEIANKFPGHTSKALQERLRRHKQRKQDSGTKVHRDVVLPVLMPKKKSKSFPAVSAVEQEDISTKGPIPPSNITFGDDDTSRLIDKRESTSLTWKEIAKEFPGHTPAALNARYRRAKIIIMQALASKDAVWLLASVMSPKLPDFQWPTGSANRIFHVPTLHIAANIIQPVMDNNVNFKLTADTIAAAVQFHETFHHLDVKAKSSDPSKEKLHNDFEQAIRRFTFSIDIADAYKSLEEDGTGALLCSKSVEVRDEIIELMKLYVPPRPRVAEEFCQPPPPPPPPMLLPAGFSLNHSAPVSFASKWGSVFEDLPTWNKQMGAWLMENGGLDRSKDCHPCFAPNGAGFALASRTETAVPNSQQFQYIQPPGGSSYYNIA